MQENGETPLIDATNAKINNPSLDCSNLRDPLWALHDSKYQYAPSEPETVDRTASAPLSVATPNNPPTPQASTNAALSNNMIGIALPPGPPKSNDCPMEFTGYWAIVGFTSYMCCQGGAVLGDAQPCIPGTLFEHMGCQCFWMW